MTNLSTFVKDPDAVLDYGWDWSDWLGTDTITSKTITVPTGITKTTDSASSTAVLAWLSGGTVGVTYPVACRIVTVQGRTDERTLHIRIVNR